MTREKIIVDRQRIANDKTRITTYKKRKDCLYRKAGEFSTLCGVQTCLIVYGPTKATDEVVSEPEIWPDETKARDIIRRYRDSVSNSCRKEAHVANFVNDLGKAKGMENKTNKRVKRNHHKFCSWDEKLDKCSQEQLLGVFDAVTNKLQEAILRQDRMIRAHHQAMETPFPQILMDPHYMSQYFAEQQQQLMLANYNNLGFPVFSSQDDQIQTDPNLLENLTDLGLNQGLMMSKGNDGTQFMQRQAPYYNLEPVVPRSATFNANPFPGYQGSFNIPWRLPGNQVGAWDFLEKKSL
ncbi:hypothetical protein EUTSA_v10015500mg [Eutrema salsugineum]|uniref:MADS-box domain-containing protein n=1 Tax=Eutrema salsugineum TaxID=72664 RepID=V4N9P7_EUTSA|nr:agamous-like MADS-box protein AGL82 [Eutrema salsugineum]ESQ42481.1 hypothetical protein EUTSA_v10015500mg [Eutrema salsugineum]